MSSNPTEPGPSKWLLYTGVGIASVVVVIVLFVLSNSGALTSALGALNAKTEALEKGQAEIEKKVLAVEAKTDALKKANKEANKEADKLADALMTELKASSAKMDRLHELIKEIRTGKKPDNGDWRDK